MICLRQVLVFHLGPARYNELCNTLLLKYILIASHNAEFFSQHFFPAHYMFVVHQSKQDPQYEAVASVVLIKDAISAWDVAGFTKAVYHGHVCCGLH